MDHTRDRIADLELITTNLQHHTNVHDLTLAVQEGFQAICDHLRGRREGIPVNQPTPTGLVPPLKTQPAAQTETRQEHARDKSHETHRKSGT